MTTGLLAPLRFLRKAEGPRATADSLRMFQFCCEGRVQHMVCESWMRAQSLVLLRVGMRVKVGERERESAQARASVAGSWWVCVCWAGGCHVQIGSFRRLARGSGHRNEVIRPSGEQQPLSDGSVTVTVTVTGSSARLQRFAVRAGRSRFAWQAPGKALGTRACRLAVVFVSASRAPRLRQGQGNCAS